MARTAPKEHEEAQVTGPSFELPNVPLTPPISATVEFDSSMTFGPAAESEFELDQVDFDSTPIEEGEERVDEPIEESLTSEWEAPSATDESEEASADSDEPVFREPVAAIHSEPPFILPAVPRPRKKRSGVRLLAALRWAEWPAQSALIRAALDTGARWRLHAGRPVPAERRAAQII